MTPPKGCLNQKCHSTDVRYGFAKPIFVEHKENKGTFFLCEATCALCNKCGYEWTQVHYPPNG